jgi:hypothetical protein
MQHRSPAAQQHLLLQLLLKIQDWCSQLEWGSMLHEGRPLFFEASAAALGWKTESAPDTCTSILG